MTLIFFYLKSVQLFRNPNMGSGIFAGTFYLLQEPLHVDSLSIRHNQIQTRLVQDIMATERIQRLHCEMGAIGEGIIYHKDHYEDLPHIRVDSYQPLIDHSK